MNLNSPINARSVSAWSHILLALTLIAPFPTGLATAKADIQFFDDVVTVSLIRLIAFPEKYDGKRIQVRGYYVRGFEASSLYPTKEDHEMYNLPNQIRISIEGIRGDKIGGSKTFRGYVTVIGRFHYAPELTKQLEIRDVTLLEVVPKY